MATEKQQYDRLINRAHGRMKGFQTLFYETGKPHYARQADRYKLLWNYLMKRYAREHSVFIYTP